MKNEKMKFENLKSLLRQRIPGQLVIQMTDRCNARCPQCGMRVTEKFERSTLDTDEIKQMLDAAAPKGVAAVSFTGGEPMLYLNELAELMRYAGSAGIEYIRTGTNGFFFVGSDKPGFERRIHTIAQTLADTPVRNFWISLDSALPGVHEKMRGFPGLIKGLEKGIPIFHQYGLYPSVNLGINRNIARGAGLDGPARTPAELAAFYRGFQQAFAGFYRFVIDLGFTIVNSCYPMSIEPDADDLNAVYVASSQDRVVKFNPQEKIALFRALMETIPRFRSQIRIFSPRTSLYALCRQYAEGQENAYPCRGGIDFFFVDAKDGKTYPCGYRGGEDLGKFWEMALPSPNGNPCYACDWECFRDPSELFGPFLNSLSHPVQTLKKFSRDPGYFHLWTQDLRYYRACGFFNGRQPPDYQKMAKFDSADSAL